MRVLVTGASGTIGSALARTLAARGDTVIGLSRNPARAAARLPQLDWHRWDPPAAPPRQALAGCEAVVNLVGERIDQRLTAAAKERIRTSRIDATNALVDALAALPDGERPRALVSQSAVGYYGDRGDEELTERSAPGDDFLARVCVDWERAAQRAEGAGVRVCVLRTGLVLDRSSGLLGRLLPIFRLGLGGRVGSGRQWMPWIHLEDEVGLLVWALDHDVHGTVNATAPNPVRNGDFTRSLAQTLRRPALFPVPRAALALVFGGELAAVLVASQRALPTRALQEGYRFRWPDLDGALGHLVGRTPR